GNSKSRRNRCARVRRVEHVVLGFLAPQETAQAFVLSDRRELIATARDDLMRISLMADVDHQLVARRVEGVMQRNYQLDRTEARARVAADLRERLDHVLANLVGERLKLRLRQLAQVRGIIDLWKQLH